MYWWNSCRCSYRLFYIAVLCGRVWHKPLCRPKLVKLRLCAIIACFQQYASAPTNRILHSSSTVLPICCLERLTHRSSYDSGFHCMYYFSTAITFLLYLTCSSILNPLIIQQKVVVDHFLVAMMCFLCLWIIVWHFIRDHHIVVLCFVVVHYYTQIISRLLPSLWGTSIRKVL